MSIYGDLVLAESGLLGYWHLDETTGTSAADSKGSHTGTHVNTPTLGVAPLVPGTLGKAVTYSRASSERTTAADASDLKGNAALTLECWVSFSALPATGELYGLIGKVGSFFLVLFNEAGTSKLYGSGNFVDPGIKINWSPSIGVTYHVVMTWSDASNTTTFYVNGALLGSGTQSSAANAGTTDVLEIGAFNSTNYLNGTLDEPAVYNAVLSSGAVAAHFNARYAYSASDSGTGTETSSISGATGPTSATDTGTGTDARLSTVVGVTPVVGAIKLLAVGDSNTSGGYVGQAWTVWVDRVQAALAAQFPSATVTATNNAVGGTTTYELSVNYATWVGDEAPSVIVCVEGTNDVYYDTPSPGGAPRGDGVDYSATGARARVEAIIESARTLTDAAGRRAKFVLCSPPPAAVLADGTTLWRDATRLSAMRDAMAAAATARGVTFVDLWTLMQVNPAWKTDYLTDGVHLTNAGQQFVADQIAAAVTPVPPSGELGIGTEGTSTVTIVSSLSGSDSGIGTDVASVTATDIAPTIVLPPLSEVIAASHTVAVLVEVLENGEVVEELYTVIDGTVTLDQTAASRGRCDIALVDDGSLGLVPNDAGDLLAPYGNELRISRGVIHTDDTTEYVRLGVFRIETATVDDTPDSLLIRIAGLDRSARIIAARFEEPYQVTDGTNYTTAIEDVIAAAYPDVVTDLTATSRTTPQLIAQEGDDRWAFAQDMARAIGMTLYFDGDGTLVLRPVSAFGQTPVAVLAEGEDGLLVQASRGWTRQGAFNRVIATGENTGLAAPARGTATDDNPLSPTYYYGPFGKVPRFYASPFITTDEQAADAAQAILARELGTTESVDFGSIVNPALKPDDVVSILRLRAGIDEDHIIDSITIPLTAEGGMTGKTRATQVNAGTVGS